MELKRIITEYIFAAVIILALIICIQNPYFVDKYILLENVKPNYWKYLGEAINEYGQLLKSSEKIEKRRNLIVNTLGEIKGDGFILTTNPDGSITFCGKNNGEKVSYIFYSIYANDLEDGEYWYDDKLDEKGIQSYVEGCSYYIGGEKKQTTLTGQRNIFTADKKRFSFYNFCIDIEPGVSFDSITFYPMLYRLSERDDKYEPCATSYLKGYNADTSSFCIINITKDNISNIDTYDLDFLIKSMKGRNNNLEWVTLSFGDKTGFQINSNMTTNNGYYGKIDAIGVVNNHNKKILNLEELKEIESAEIDIGDINNLGAYLSILRKRKYVIFISIKDEGTRNILPTDISSFRKIGLKGNFNDKIRYSYLAIVDEGNVLIDEIKRGALDHKGVLRDGLEYDCHSQGTTAGTSSIIINGKEYSMNHRGMNFVIYDYYSHSVIDSVAFDTFFDQKAYRRCSFEQQLK